MQSDKKQIMVVIFRGIFERKILCIKFLKDPEF